MKDTLTLIRVQYGKDNVDFQDREYQSQRNGAVGTAKEIAEFCKRQNLDKILLLDKTGINIEQVIFFNGLEYQILVQPTLLKKEVNNA